MRPPQGNPYSILQRVEMDDSEVNTDEGVRPMHNGLKYLARAQLIIDKQQCAHGPKTKALLVQGISQAHAVKVLSKNSCTCPPKHEWYHIVAAKLYLGTGVGKRQKRINNNGPIKKYTTKMQQTEGI